MIGYALGRNPQASDRRLMGEMVRAGSEASFTDLATAIATSRQFRYRAGSASETATPAPAAAPTPVPTATSARATPQ